MAENRAVMSVHDVDGGRRCRVQRWGMAEVQAELKRGELGATYC